jgi:hypothetical protein
MVGFFLFGNSFKSDRLCTCLAHQKEKPTRRIGFSLLVFS